MPDNITLKPDISTKRVVSEQVGISAFFVRLLFTIIIVGICLLWIFSTTPEMPIDTENINLLERAIALTVDGEHDWLVELFPPFPLLLALLAVLLPVPYGSLFLGLIGLMAISHLLVMLIRGMWHRHIPLILIVSLSAVLIFSPVFIPLAATNLSTTLALTSFSLGLKYANRFLLWNDTRSGFTAGTLLLFAGFCDLLALAGAILIALVLPVMQHIQRAHPDNPIRGARRANILILLFPISASLAAWALWSIIFSPGALWSHIMEMAMDTNQHFTKLVSALEYPGGLLLYGSLIAGTLAAMVSKNSEIFFGSCLTFLTISAGYITSMTTNGGFGLIFIVNMILFMTMLRPPKNILRTSALATIIVTLFIATWYGASTTTTMIV